MTILLGSYMLFNVIRIVKPTRLDWAGHVPRVWDTRGTYKILMENSD